MSLHYNHAPQISEIQIQSYELKKQKQKHKTTDFLNHWEGRKNIEGIQFDGRKKNTVQGYIHFIYTCVYIYIFIYTYIYTDHDFWKQKSFDQNHFPRLSVAT